ncbi:phage tail protein [Aureibacter tunicatorum]|uniref:Microcystin-dependent protein n=1 Tax=Aureibacter tunicatorum TaxID=866807 RepID=A0AAE3XJL4_9BACT|nr:tail fiber protein [Aureibacter tunicatorum]MDR6238941.1 microcystin-dependent protein [Aureibacter tunicatorum]BDD05133.1 microcystin dependent MdpB family protein [Aureibacter tunicatorum]
MEGTIGEIRLFGGNFAPRAWALCNGQLLSIAQNTALFSILGTTYGGDGRTTFALPDLRGRAAISSGTGPGLSTHKLGARSGTETVVLSQLQIPSHNHSAQFTQTAGVTHINAVADSANQEDPTNNYLAAANIAGTNQIYSDKTPDSQLASSPVTVTGTVAVGLTGASQDHNNMQPYLVVHYIICLQGVFPSRS